MSTEPTEKTYPFSYTQFPGLLFAIELKEAMITKLVSKIEMVFDADLGGVPSGADLAKFLSSFPVLKGNVKTAQKSTENRSTVFTTFIRGLGDFFAPQIRAIKDAQAKWGKAAVVTVNLAEYDYSYRPSDGGKGKFAFTSQDGEIQVVIREGNKLLPTETIAAIDSAYLLLKGAVSAKLQEANLLKQEGDKLINPDVELSADGLVVTIGQHRAPREVTKDAAGNVIPATKNQKFDVIAPDGKEFHDLGQIAARRVVYAHACGKDTSKLDSIVTAEEATAAGLLAGKYHRGKGGYYLNKANGMPAFTRAAEAKGYIVVKK